MVFQMPLQQVFCKQLYTTPQLIEIHLLGPPET